MPVVRELDLLVVNEARVWEVRIEGNDWMTRGGADIVASTSHYDW